MTEDDTATTPDAAPDAPDDDADDNTGHERTPDEGMAEDSRPGGEEGSFVDADHGDGDDDHDDDPGSYTEADRGDGEHRQDQDHGHYEDHDQRAPDD